jgi:hypothetical protein
MHKKLDIYKWRAKDMWRKFKRTVNRAKHYINGGYSCQCGRKYQLAGYMVEGDVNGRRMLFENHGKPDLCPLCVDERIGKFFETTKVGKKNHYSSGPFLGTCDFTKKKNVPVVRIIWGTDNNLGLDVRFGAEWWNGFQASREAFGILLTETGKMKTSYITMSKKEVLFRDRNGVGSKGQLVKDIK